MVSSGESLTVLIVGFLAGRMSGLGIDLRLPLLANGSP